VKLGGGLCPPSEPPPNDALRAAGRPRAGPRVRGERSESCAGKAGAQTASMTRALRRQARRLAAILLGHDVDVGRPAEANVGDVRTVTTLWRSRSPTSSSSVRIDSG